MHCQVRAHKYRGWCAASLPVPPRFVKYGLNPWEKRIKKSFILQSSVESTTYTLSVLSWDQFESRSLVDYLTWYLRVHLKNPSNTRRGFPGAAHPQQHLGLQGSREANASQRLRNCKPVKKSQSQIYNSTSSTIINTLYTLLNRYIL